MYKYLLPMDLSTGSGKRNCTVVWWSLPRVLRQLRLSASDKGDNEIITDIVHIFPGIYITAEENPRKTLLGVRLMKGMRPVIASNGIPYLQMTSVESHSMSGRDKETKKGLGAWSILL